MKAQRGIEPRCYKGVSDHNYAPATLPPGKNRQPFYRWLVRCPRHKQIYFRILCLWFLSSLIYINNCTTICNTKQSFIILQVHSTCFGCQPHPSSGVHKTVNIASVTGHIFCAATSLQRGQAWSRMIDTRNM